MLRERWPVVFCVPRPPLAIGVRERILEVAGDAVDSAQLGRFLSWWTQRSDYLDAIAHGEPRRNLDGSPAGEPDEAQRRQAAGEVYGHRAATVLERIEARRETAP
jgi:sRNA-binding protein